MTQPGPTFRIVLHEPEIPNNTGNIGRTAIATGCDLHLIRPLGFDTSEKACRRAGLDYWPRLRVREHDSWEAFLAGAGRAPRVWAFSTKARRVYDQAVYEPGDVLLFGKETRGLPEALLIRYEPTLLKLPMVEGERSLNLATAVCAAVYEGLRQLRAGGRLSLTEAGNLPRRNSDQPPELC